MGLEAPHSGDGGRADEEAVSMVQPGEREVMRLDLGKTAGEWPEGSREGPGHGREIHRPGMKVGLSPRREKMRCVRGSEESRSGH